MAMGSMLTNRQSQASLNMAEAMMQNYAAISASRANQQGGYNDPLTARTAWLGNSPDWLQAVSQYNAGQQLTNPGFLTIINEAKSYLPAGTQLSVANLATARQGYMNANANKTDLASFLPMLLPLAIPAAGMLMGAGAAGASGVGASAGAAGTGVGAVEGVGVGGQLLSSAAPIMMDSMTGSYLTAAQLAAAPGAIGTASTLTQATQALANAGITPQQVAANSSNPSWLQSVSQATGLSPSALSTVASTGLNMLGSYAQGQAATGAAQTSANAQIEAARIAADAQRLQLPNITGNMFGTNQSTYDAQGRLTSAGSTAAPWLAQQQGTLQGMTAQQLAQYQGAPAATAPMGTAAQTMMGLGQGYLQTSPQAQAQQYMNEQQALLAGSRASDISSLLNRQQNQGRGGLAMGGGGGMIPANPEMQAYYNSLNQQNLQLAANATQGGQQYAQFGAGMVGAGGQMIQDQMAAQNATFTPYGTTMNGLNNLQALQNQPLNQSLQFGSPATAASAAGGQFQAQGMMNAAQTMQPANAYSPWGAMLSGAGNSISNYQTQQQQQQQQQFQNNLTNQFITGKV